jgi:hypothetical protein
MASAWLLMRDVTAGQRAIHMAAERYLPKLSKEKDPDYAARLARTPFFAATGRTVEGLVGMMFRKDPVVRVSAGTEAMLADVTKGGVPFNAFANQVATERLTPGRVGVLVDYPNIRRDANAPPLTVAQVEAMNIRPHMALYRSEDIINWQWSWINNRFELSLLVLHEVASIPGLDKFTPIQRDRWRVIELVANSDEQPDQWRALDSFGADETMREWRCQVSVWEQGAGADQGFSAVIEPFFPMRKGKPLQEIEFHIFGDGKPPLEDLANVNVSHYQTTADLEHGAHKTALPQPWVSGVDARVDPRTGQPIAVELHIGGGEAWAFPNPATQVGMLEYNGTGLGALENRITVKERQMAVLGARMLEQQKAGVETAEAAAIHRSGEQSALQKEAGDLGRGLARVLGWFDLWAGGSGDVSCEVNKDFFQEGMDAPTITAIVAAWQAGGMSDQAKFENFKRGGLYSDEDDFETEQARIANSGPTLLLAAPPVTPGAGGA